MVSENDLALLKEIAVEIVDLLFNKNSNSLVSNKNVFFDETKTTIDYYFKSSVENKIVFNSKNKLNDCVVSEENTILLKEIAKKWIEILITSVLKTMYFFTLDF